MAYKQPRVPSMQEGTRLTDYIRELVLFLKDFCLAAWNADRQKDKEIEDIKKRLNALDGGNS